MVSSSKSAENSVGGLFGGVLGQVFDPGVIRAGCGRVHLFRDFVSRWLRRHGFGRGLVLVSKVDQVGDRRF